MANLTPYTVSRSEDGTRVRVVLPPEGEMDVEMALALMQGLQEILGSRTPPPAAESRKEVEFAAKRVRLRHDGRGVTFHFELSDREHSYRLPVKQAEELAERILQREG